jgi:hypothetical protein
MTMTHLETGFGGVRFRCFGVGVALSTCLATSFTYILISFSSPFTVVDGAGAGAYLCRQACLWIIS